MQAGQEYPSERKHQEQESVIKDMKGLVKSPSLGSFVARCSRVVERLFLYEASDVVGGAAEQWETITDVPFLCDGCDLGCQMKVRLRQLLPVTT